MPKDYSNDPLYDFLMGEDITRTAGERFAAKMIHGLETEVSYLKRIYERQIKEIAEMRDYQIRIERTPLEAIAQRLLALSGSMTSLLTILQNIEEMAREGFENGQH